MYSYSTNKIGKNKVVISNMATPLSVPLYHVSGTMWDSEIESAKVYENELEAIAALKTYIRVHTKFRGG